VTTVLATAADARYGWWLLNMLGSVKANSDIFDTILAYDLGLEPKQRRLLDRVRGVEVRTVPPFVKHWREGFTWKTWIWTHVETDRLVWLDAGLTVLRPLDEMTTSIDACGYFAVSQGHPVADMIPNDWYGLYGLSQNVARDRFAIAAGIFGFARGSAFYNHVVQAVFEDCVEGRSLGFSAGDAARLNRGLNSSPEPTIRNCKHFRWDQSVLNARFYTSVTDPVIHDLYKFAGWRSRHDHPEQVIWSHRRTGEPTYMTRIPFRGGTAVTGRLFGIHYRLRSWRITHSWLFDWRTYSNKLRRVSTRRPKRELAQGRRPSPPT
jgi:hypothetical protein